MGLITYNGTLLVDSGVLASSLDCCCDDATSDCSDCVANCNDNEPVSCTITVVSQAGGCDDADGGTANLSHDGDCYWAGTVGDFDVEMACVEVDGSDVWVWYGIAYCDADNTIVVQSTTFPGEAIAVTCADGHPAGGTYRMTLTSGFGDSVTIDVDLS